MNQTAANRTADIMHRLDSADLSVHSVAEPVGHQPTGDEPEECNPASATSEANREQDQRDQMTKYQTDAIRPYLAPKLEIHQKQIEPATIQAEVVVSLLVDAIKAAAPYINPTAKPAPEDVQELVGAAMATGEAFLRAMVGAKVSVAVEAEEVAKTNVLTVFVFVGDEASAASRNSRRRRRNKDFPSS